jgi:hypothetical protein
MTRSSREFSVLMSHCMINNGEYCNRVFEPNRELTEQERNFKSCRNCIWADMKHEKDKEAKK